jgi:hypothetical protein
MGDIQDMASPLKISFCTTCMNRLDDLRITLPANIQANASYPNCEFVLLDYNSTDGLAEWISRKMKHHIESGKLIYYRTDEPKYYSMSHSRNVAFRLASGDIVNNIDADNFTFDGAPCSICFAAWLNEQAILHPAKTVFAKTKQVTIMHGRVGFYKNEFINDLGGYDEDFEGYGHDDQDIVQRALGLGFKIVKWGSSYFYRIQTPPVKKNENLLNDWDETRRKNRELSYRNIESGRFQANKSRQWGKAEVTKNFKETIVL